MKYILRVGMVVLLLVMPVMAQAASDKEPAQARQIQKICADKGPVQAVRWLTAGDGSRWRYVMEQIATGKEEWLGTVPCLTFGSDAGYATDVTFALATALPINPQGVLQLEAGHVSLKWACSFPFIESQSDFISKYEMETTVALRSISDPYLQMDAQICLMRLERALDKAKSQP